MSDLDQGNLSAWMDKAVAGFAGITRLEKFPGGQSNPTYRLETADKTYVLRRRPFGTLLPSAHAIDREFRLMSALRPTGFPVPTPVVYCEDEGVIGAQFYLMEMVAGRTYWDGTLPEISAGLRGAYYESLVDALARLHSLDPVRLGLGDFGAPGNYVERQVQRWTKQYRAAQTDEIAEVEKLIEWLPLAMPAQARTSIIHGDYRIDNVIFAAGQPEMLAVLDWELATTGDPIADFAYFAMAWIMPNDGDFGLGGIDLEVAGIPSLDEVVARYCRALGLDGLPYLRWYFAFNLFRLVGIIQGIKKRLQDGNASNAKAAETVAKLEPLARLGWHQARLAGAAD